MFRQNSFPQLEIGAKFVYDYDLIFYIVIVRMKNVPNGKRIFLYPLDG